MSKKQDILWIKSSIFKKKQKSCGNCNTINHTTNKYHTSRNIEKIIDGDLLAEFLQDTCPFIVIESDIYANVFCESLDLTKVQQLKYHQLLSNIIPYINQRQNIDNLLVKVTCCAKYGLAISWFANVMF